MADITKTWEELPACRMCKRQFLFVTIRDQHEACHSKETPMMKCFVCGWAYKDFFALQYHCRSVHNCKPFNSSENNNKSSVRRSPPLRSRILGGSRKQDINQPSVKSQEKQQKDGSMEPKLKDGTLEQRTAKPCTHGNSVENFSGKDPLYLGALNKATERSTRQVFVANAYRPFVENCEQSQWAVKDVNSTVVRERPMQGANRGLVTSVGAQQPKGVAATQSVTLLQIPARIFVPLSAITRPTRIIQNDGTLLLSLNIPAPSRQNVTNQTPLQSLRQASSRSNQDTSRSKFARESANFMDGRNFIRKEATGARLDTVNYFSTSADVAPDIGKESSENTSESNTLIPTGDDLTGDVIDENCEIETGEIANDGEIVSVLAEQTDVSAKLTEATDKLDDAVTNQLVQAPDKLPRSSEMSLDISANQDLSELSENRSGPIDGQEPNKRLVASEIKKEDNQLINTADNLPCSSETNPEISTSQSSELSITGPRDVQTVDDADKNSTTTGRREEVQTHDSCVPLSAPEVQPPVLELIDLTLTESDEDDMSCEDIPDLEPINNNTEDDQKMIIDLKPEGEKGISTNSSAEACFRSHKKKKHHFICDNAFCRKTFKTPTALRRHKALSHIGKRRVKCPKCLKQVYLSNRALHLTTHDCETNQQQQQEQDAVPGNYNEKIVTTADPEETVTMTEHVNETDTVAEHLHEAHTMAENLDATQTMEENPDDTDRMEEAVSEADAIANDPNDKDINIAKEHEKDPPEELDNEPRTIEENLSKKSPNEDHGEIDTNIKDAMVESAEQSHCQNVNEKPEKLPKTCELCPQTFESHAQRNYHLANHDKLTHKCPIKTCGFLFENLSDLKSHCQSYHDRLVQLVEDNDVPDRGKKKKLSDESDDISAYKKAWNNYPTCGMCGRKFMLKAKRDHHEANHGKMKYRCPCGYLYLQTPDLNLHLRYHHKVTEPRIDYLKYRIKGVTDYENKQASFQCKICNRKFQREDLWKYHSKYHDEMVYRCPNPCGYMFKDFDNFRRHCSCSHKIYVSKKQTQNYRTQEKLSDTNSQRSDIQIAERGCSRQFYKTVDQRINSKCHICSRKFLKKDLLEFHIVNHDRMKYKCPESGCNKLFLNIKCLKDHYRHGHHKDFSKVNKSDYIITSSSSVERNQANEKKSNQKQKKAGVENCPLCNREFDSENFREFHVRNHKMAYFCPENGCGNMFINFTRFQQHTGSCHKRRKFDEKERERKIIHSVNNVKDSRSENDETGTKDKPKRIEPKNNEQINKINTKPRRNSKRKCTKCGRKFTNSAQRESHENNHHLMRYGCLISDCKHVFKEFQNVCVHSVKYHGKTITLDQRNDCQLNKNLHIANGINQSSETKVEIISGVVTNSVSGATDVVTSSVSRCSDLVGSSVSRTIKAASRSQKEKFDQVNTKQMDLSKPKKRFKSWKIQCELCHRRFMTKEKRDDHVSHHDEMVYRCPDPECGHMFQDLRYFKKHYSDNHKFYLGTEQANSCKINQNEKSNESVTGGPGAIKNVDTSNAVIKTEDDDMVSERLVNTADSNPIFVYEKGTAEDDEVKISADDVDDAETQNTDPKRAESEATTELNTICKHLEVNVAMDNKAAGANFENTVSNSRFEEAKSDYNGSTSIRKQISNCKSTANATDDFTVGYKSIAYISNSEVQHENNKEDAVLWDENVEIVTNFGENNIDCAIDDVAQIGSEIEVMNSIETLESHPTRTSRDETQKIQMKTTQTIPDKRRKIYNKTDADESNEGDDNRNQNDNGNEVVPTSGDENASFCAHMVVPALGKLHRERKSVAKLNIQAILHNIEFRTSIPTMNVSHIKNENGVGIHGPAGNACFPSAAEDNFFCVNIIIPVLTRLQEERKSWAKVEIQRLLYEAQFSVDA